MGSQPTDEFERFSTESDSFVWIAIDEGGSQQAKIERPRVVTEVAKIDQLHATTSRSTAETDQPRSIPHQAAKPRTLSLLRASSRARTRMVS
ncbi:hypothetical protein [Nocardia araoensis]|uniref:hypothetical protein n=1 Tax=Nocardia araoensis TaxID=228600 RepID=UPI00031ACC40|nr:hypothetical protein [Nocardia araoensis]